MNRFALLSLYRSLTRHKLYAALNIGGLAIGIAVFIVLGLYVFVTQTVTSRNPIFARSIFVNANYMIGLVLILLMLSC